MGFGSYSANEIDVFHTNPRDNPISIGSFSSIGFNLKIIGDGLHNPAFVTTSPLYMIFHREPPGGPYAATFGLGEIEIGNDVWIGDNVTIIGGLKVGDGSIIGTGAVVTHDVPPYSIVGGVPARLIKWRFPEEVRRTLQDLKWWALPPAQIRSHIGLLLAPATDSMMKLQKLVDESRGPSTGKSPSTCARENESGL